MGVHSYTVCIVAYSHIVHVFITGFGRAKSAIYHRRCRLYINSPLPGMGSFFLC